jgi:hypothetical protein
MADEIEMLQEQAKAAREAREERQSREAWEQLERIELRARLKVIRRVPVAAAEGSDDGT